MTRRRAPRRMWLVVAVLILSWLGLMRPWTIRPIDSRAGGPFEAASYVDSIWDSRVRPAIRENAVTLEVFLATRKQAGAATRPAAVAIEGVIVEVDTSSRVGLALIDVDPGDGRADAAVQVGPVLRGTALRDVLEFIRFTDFTNQIEFAAVAAALNNRVAVSVLRDLDPAVLAGRRARVAGAALIDASSPDALVSIVPVELTLEARP